MTKPLTERQRKTLKIVAIILIVSGIAVIGYPFFPLLKYNLSNPEPEYPYPTKLLSEHSDSLPQIADIEVNEEGLPRQNRLVIPKIGVDIEILSSDNEAWALNLGAWHMDRTGTPDSGNMVISAHRFRYRPPSQKTFYLLDKVVIGDNFIIYWHEQEYDYVVTDTKIVASDDTSILNQTDENQVTLFTCTPLFSTEKRLVVIGQPI